MNNKLMARYRRVAFFLNDLELGPLCFYSGTLFKTGKENRQIAADIRALIIPPPAEATEDQQKDAASLHSAWISAYNQAIQNGAKCSDLQAENDCLKAERDWLNASSVAVKAERDELKAENERLRERMVRYDAALTEAEAIMGGEYEAHYGPFSKLVEEARK